MVFIAISLYTWSNKHYLLSYMYGFFIPNFSPHIKSIVTINGESNLSETVINGMATKILVIVIINLLNPFI